MISDANNDVLNATFGTLGNPRAVRTITVTNGAALTLKNCGTFGAGTSASRILTTLNIVGGTLNMPPNWGNIVGPVIFDNATLTYSGGQPSGYRYWGTIIFGSNVIFRGTNVYNFPVVGNENTCGFTFGKYEPSDIFVADITGDAGSDVIFGLPIHYTPGDNGVNTRFTKRGPGTLELSYGKNSYTGDVSVAEGTLFLNGRQVSQTNPFSPLGNPRVPHRLYVGTNALLHFNQSDVMGQAFALVDHHRDRRRHTETDRGQGQLVRAADLQQREAGVLRTFRRQRLVQARLLYQRRQRGHGLQPGRQHDHRW